MENHIDPPSGNNSEEEKSSNSNDPTKGLTSLQRDRYYSILTRFKERSRQAVLSVTAKGRNSWPEFLRKNGIVNGASGDLLKYYEAIALAFDLREAYTRHQITQTVCDLRARYNQQPFTEGIPQLALDEFFLCFIAEEDLVESEDDDGRYKVYTPVFAIVAD